VRCSRIVLVSIRPFVVHDVLSLPLVTHSTSDTNRPLAVSSARFAHLIEGLYGFESLLRMLSSGMCLHVFLVGTGVSEESITSSFSVKINELKHFIFS
jgi:hypothetical protein